MPDVAEIAIEKKRRPRNRKAKSKGTVLLAPVQTSSGKAARRRRRRQRVRQMQAIGASSIGGFARPRDDGLGSVIMGEMGIEGIPGSARTVSGSMWLNKYLDPCHPSMGVLGIPDEDTSNVATPQFKGTGKIDNSVAGMTHVSPTDLNEWDETAVWNFVYIVDWSTMTTCILKWQGDLRSSDTSELSMYVTTSPTGDLIPTVENWWNSNTGIDALRLMYAGLTLEPSMAALSNQGEMVAAQVKPRYGHVYTADAGLPDAPNYTAKIDVSYWSLSSSLNEKAYPYSIQTWLDQLQLLDEQCLAGPAREGAYFPVRSTEPTHSYRTWDGATTPGAPESFGVDKRFLIPPFTSATTQTAVGGGLAYANIKDKECRPFPFSAANGNFPWNATIMYCTGLDSTSSFQTVFRYGLEAQLTPIGKLGGPWAPFMHASPTCDPRALETANAVRVRMSSAYPASYNFLDKLWGVVKGIGKTVIPGLASAIPVVGPAVGNMLTGLFRGKASQRMPDQSSPDPTEMLVKLLANMSGN